jgi:hypothetical protein
MPLFDSRRLGTVGFVKQTVNAYLEAMYVI